MELRDWIRTEHQELLVFFEQTVLSLVPREHLTTRAGGEGNSIAWLMWHLARVEDVTINSVVRGKPQVLMAGNWQERLGIADQRIGTGLQDAEVEEFSRAINLDELYAYWKAVKQETGSWLASVPLEVLDIIPDLDARLSTIPAVVPEQGSWALDFWRGKPGSFFLRSSVIGHGYLHLGEMRAIAGRLGFRAR